MSTDIVTKESASPVLVDVVLRISKFGLGAELSGGEFEFAVFEQNNEIVRAANDAKGLIVFPYIRFTSPGVHHYTIKEVDAPAGWQPDTRVYPVSITVSLVNQALVAEVVYPEGMPGFKNRHDSETCGIVEFDNIEFDKIGEYKFKIRELTPSGGGWVTDPGEAEVTVHVIDDGYGNLVATVEYLHGFPLFINKYETKPVKVVISACKIAVGAALPEGRFEFGLYDEEGELIAKAKNAAAKESV